MISKHYALPLLMNHTFQDGSTYLGQGRPFIDITISTLEHRQLFNQDGSTIGIKPLIHYLEIFVPSLNRDCMILKSWATLEMGLMVSEGMNLEWIKSTPYIFAFKGRASSSHRLAITNSQFLGKLCRRKTLASKSKPNTVMAFSSQASADWTSQWPNPVPKSTFPAHVSAIIKVCLLEITYNTKGRNC